MAKRKSTKRTDKDPRVDLVESLVTFSLLGMQDANVIDTYNRGMRYWKGEHKIRMRDPAKGNRVYNKFAEIIETRIAHLTDAKPKWLFRPQESGDIQIAHFLNEIMGDIVWDYIDWDRGEDGGGKGEDTLLQASFAGSAHIKTVLDIKTGMPNFIVIPTGMLLPDPKAKKKKDLRYWIHLVPTSVKHIKRQYGVDVSPQADLEKIKDQGKASFHRPQITGQLDTTNDKFPSLPFLVDKSGRRSAMGDAEGMGKAIVIECWMESHEMQAIPFNDEEAEAEHNAFRAGDHASVRVKADEHHPKHIAAHRKFIETLDPEADAEVIKKVEEHIAEHDLFPQESSRRKYPFGKIIAISQGKFLSERANPFGKVGLDFKDVLIKVDYHKDPECYWGKPLTTDLFDPQDDINHRKNSITQNINLLNTGIRKIQANLYERLGIKDNPSIINNLPGNIIPFRRDPNEFTTDFGTPMPNQIWVDLNWTEKFMETQSLHQGPAAGRLPGAGTANVTLETLLGEFKTILRKPLRHYAGGLAEMGRNAVLLMSEYLDKGEVFLILNQDQQTFQEIRWGDISSRARLLRNVRIDTTEMMPTTRLETFRRVIEMMQAGVPPEAAIQLMDDPKAIQVMQTMSQINQLTAALQQMGEENEQLKQQLNTLTNRLQGQLGGGNVGIFETG